MNQTEFDTDGKCCAFIIPVRHPKGKKVSDYGTIEALLKTTVHSLLNQTHRNVSVIVVCSQVPDWANELDRRVTFVDVSNDDVFDPDLYHFEIDKGLRYAVGSLYAISTVRPDLIMLLDADDYVHVELAERLLSNHNGDSNLDGYLIRRGIHLGVDVQADRSVRYSFAVEVREFDFTCGSCRIFDASRLAERLLEMSPETAKRFASWQTDNSGSVVSAARETLQWLAEITEKDRAKDDHIINLMGRHERQTPYFQFQEVDYPAAAKGCGHGNHTGPRRGAIHWFRVVRRIPLSECLKAFGLPRQRWSFDYLAMVRTRSADKRAGNVWEDK